VKPETITLQADKVIAFRPEIARHLKSTEAAIYYQQLLYWSDKGKRTDGFVYKTKVDIEQETSLNRYQQDKARNILEKKGWITSKLFQANGSPTLHFKCNMVIGTILSGSLVEGELMDKSKVSYSITEITTENTKNDNDNGVPTKVVTPTLKNKIDQLEDTNNAVRVAYNYYFQEFPKKFKRNHPFVKSDQKNRVLSLLQEFTDSWELNGDQWKIIIDKHFSTPYDMVDFNINHFAQREIITNRYYETCY
jgi:hypothetical protein